LTGDVNGDGQTDLLYVYPNGTPAVYSFISQGNGQYQSEGYSLGSGFDAGSGTWLTGDVNGDGETDLLYVYPNGTPAVYSYISQGNGQYQTNGYSLGSGFDAASGTWQTGDVNGDGQTDLLYVYPNGTPAIDSFISQGNGQFGEEGYSLGSGFDAGSGTWMTTAYTPARPGTASSLTTRPGNDSVQLAWQAPSESVAPISAYRITPYVGGVPETTQTFLSTAMGETVTGLTNGTSYTFAVAAVNDGGVGAADLSAAITVGTPLAPTAIRAKPGHRRATIRWTKPLGNGTSAVTGYVVTPYISGVAQPAKIFMSRKTVERFRGLAKGATYVFGVAAINANGTGPESTLSTAVTVH
jgi:hypothetical protein